jgi:hypothetical protein
VIDEMKASIYEPVWRESTTPMTYPNLPWEETRQRAQIDRHTYNTMERSAVRRSRSGVDRMFQALYSCDISHMYAAAAAAIASKDPR